MTLLSVKIKRAKLGLSNKSFKFSFYYILPKISDQLLKFWIFWFKILAQREYSWIYIWTIVLLVRCVYRRTDNNLENIFSLPCPNRNDNSLNLCVNNYLYFNGKSGKKTKKYDLRKGREERRRPCIQIIDYSLYYKSRVED